jgi:hypothetical protein
MSQLDRSQAVADLVFLRRPLPDAVAQLRSFPWDADQELVTLGPAALQAVLERTLGGELSAQQLEDWANAVEGRDDIAFEPQAMVDLVAEVANPVLYEPLTTDTVLDLLGRLKALEH